MVNKVKTYGDVHVMQIMAYGQISFKCQAISEKSVLVLKYIDNCKWHFFFFCSV